MLANIGLHILVLKFQCVKQLSGMSAEQRPFEYLILPTPTILGMDANETGTVRVH